jgi:hypothetical protein
MPVRRCLGNTCSPGYLAQTQARNTLLLEYLTGYRYQRAAEIAVVVLSRLFATVPTSTILFWGDQDILLHCNSACMGQIVWARILRATRLIKCQGSRARIIANAKRCSSWLMTVSTRLRTRCDATTVSVSGDHEVTEGNCLSSGTV